MHNQPDPAQPAPVSRDTRPRCQTCGCHENQHLSDGRCWSSDGCRAFVPPVAEASEETFTQEMWRLMREASEDTDPARCADCSHPDYSHWWDMELGPCRFPECACHLWVPAPASDDEITPGPSREQARDYLANAWWSGAEISFAEWEGLVDLFEAAIRAPLEAERAHEAQQAGYYFRQLAAVTAERDRLRDALQEIRRHIYEESASESYIDEVIEKVLPRPWRDQSAPATEEVQG